MKNMKIRKLLIVLLLVVVMLTISTRVFAFDPSSILGLVEDEDGDTTHQATVTQTPPDTQGQTQTPTTQTPTTQTPTTTTTDTKLPQTGDASDYIVFVAIAVSIVVSIVAYKKVRDYNNI